jgi:hypothetical protein
LGFLFLACFRGRAEGRRALIAYLAGLFLVSAAVCLYFGAHGVFSDMMYWIVKRGFMLKYGNAAPTLGATLNKFISPLTTPVDHSTKFVLLVYFAAGLLSWRRFRAGGEAEDLALFGVALLWFFALYASVVTHNGQGYTVMVSNLACILGMLWRHWAVPLPSGAPKVRPVPAWIFAAFVGAVGARGVKYVHNPGVWSHPRFALQSPRLRGMYEENEKDLAYDWMIGYVGRNAASGEAFFTFDYYAAYFATGRPSPLRATEYRNLAADEDSILQDISKPRVRWFLNKGGVEGLRGNITLIGMDRVKGYIENNFRLKEQRAGYSVWVRTDPS